MRYQPRFIAYARANGMTPEAMEAAIPNNTGFILWIQQQWREFMAEGGQPHDQNGFTRWLDGKTGGA